MASLGIAMFAAENRFGLNSNFVGSSEWTCFQIVEICYYLFLKSVF